MDIRPRPLPLGNPSQDRGTGSTASPAPPLVSVIVPSYNAEPWIERTLASVLGQTHRHLEVIVVDDGSTDATVERLRACSDPRLRVIEQANAGACVARNRALAEASGDYVQYLDADDLLSPDKIGRQVAILQRAPPGCLAVSGTVYFKDGTDPQARRGHAGYPALNSDDPVQWLLDLWTPGPGYGPGRWGMVSVHAWLVPRSVAEAAGPWDPTVLQDQDGEYFARVLMESAGVRWDPEGWAYYRKFDRPASVSGGRSERHLRGRLRAVDSKARHVMPRTTAANRAQAEAALARQYLSVAFHAHPAHPAVVREAEWKSRRFGGHSADFLVQSRARWVQPLVGWKRAKWLSHWYHRLKPPASPQPVPTGTQAS